MAATCIFSPWFAPLLHNRPIPDIHARWLRVLAVSYLAYPLPDALHLLLLLPLMVVCLGVIRLRLSLLVMVILPCSTLGKTSLMRQLTSSALSTTTSYSSSVSVRLRSYRSTGWMALISASLDPCFSSFSYGSSSSAAHLWKHGRTASSSVASIHRIGL